MTLLHPFLLSLEEFTIKSEYQNFKDLDEIDKDILPYLDSLNGLKGLATLYSCQSHPERNKHNSYIVLKCSEEMCYPLTEAIHRIEEEMDIDVDWNGSVEYNILGVEAKLDAVISIHGGTDYSYFEKLVDYLVD